MKKEDALETIGKAKEMLKDFLDFAGPASMLETVIVLRVRYSEEESQIDVSEISHCANCSIDLLDEAKRLISTDLGRTESSGNSRSLS